MVMRALCMGAYWLGMGSSRRPKPEPPPYDLGPEFNRASAWWGPPNEIFPSGWRASCHGVGGDVPALRRCGCGPCRELADYWDESVRMAGRPLASSPEPKPPAVVDIGPVRAMIVELLEGMSRTELAVAGIDKTTIARLLRPDVRAVRADTAEALLAVKGRRLRSVS
jgi:hypothetical protein